MKRGKPRAGRGGWWFLAAVIALYTVCAALAPEVATRALAHAGQALGNMLPVLALVFVLLFGFDLLLNPPRVAQLLGRPGGARGSLIALAAGILSAGPIYAWYPLLAELRAIKLPLLFHYFGAAYSVVLSLYLAMFALLSGLVMERLARTADPAG